MNAENASDGSGLMPRQHNRLLEVGVDCITMGDHIYRCKEIIPTLEESTRIIKPANYAPSASGRRWSAARREARVPAARPPSFDAEVHQLDGEAVASLYGATRRHREPEIAPPASGEWWEDERGRERNQPNSKAGT